MLDKMIQGSPFERSKYAAWAIALANVYLVFSYVKFLLGPEAADYDTTGIWIEAILFGLEAVILGVLGFVVMAGSLVASMVIAGFAVFEVLYFLYDVATYGFEGYSPLWPILLVFAIVASGSGVFGALAISSSSKQAAQVPAGNPDAAIARALAEKQSLGGEDNDSATPPPPPPGMAPTPAAQKVGAAKRSFGRRS
ncbi:MAG: hypothetical protein ACPGO3_14455 [Magnetospiraceae bacterium]